MGTIKEAWAKEDLEKLEASLCNTDMFGANLALGRMARSMSESDFAEGFQRGIENACHSILSQEELADNNAEQIEHSMSMRLNFFGGQVDDVCLMGARLAKKWTVVEAMKVSAQGQADALVGVLDHFKTVESDEMIGGELPCHVLDHGQKAFITSIAMAWALDKEGVGFDDAGLKQFATKFKDWIEPSDASLTKRGDDLWMGCGGFCETVYLDTSYNPDAPLDLMMRMADALDETVEVVPLANVAKKLRSSSETASKRQPKTK